MTSRRRIIVHLFGALNRGGAELRTLELVRADVEQGGHHVFIALSGQPGVLDAAFSDLGCEVVLMRLGWRFPVRFIRRLRAINPTHVHSHVHLASAWLLLLARLAGVECRVAHLRSQADGRGEGWRRRLYRAASRQMLRFSATDIVAVSHSTLASAKLPKVLRTKVVYDSTLPSTPGTAKAPSGELGLLFVGRLDDDKNPVRAVQILRALRATEPAARLTIVGDERCDPTGRTREAAVTGGVADAVDFLGVRDDVRSLMATAHVLLMTTRREGLPGVLIEALAEGTPVVASAIGPVEEVAARALGVIPVPLDAEDEVWVIAIRSAVARWGSPEGRGAVRAAFEASPFCSERGTPAALELWRGAS